MEGITKSNTTNTDPATIPIKDASFKLILCLGTDNAANVTTTVINTYFIIFLRVSLLNSIFLYYNRINFNKVKIILIFVFFR